MFWDFVGGSKPFNKFNYLIVLRILPGGSFHILARALTQTIAGVVVLTRLVVVHSIIRLVFFIVFLKILTLVLFFDMDRLMLLLNHLIPQQVFLLLPMEHLLLVQILTVLLFVG